MKKKYLFFKHIILKFQYDAISYVWKFIKNNLFETELFIFLCAVLSLYRYVPYVNIVVTPFIYDVTVLFLFIAIYSVNLKSLIILTVGSFGISFLLILGRMSEAADTVANLQYILLWYISIRSIIEVQKTHETNN